MKCGVDRQISAASAGMWSLYWSVTVKKLNQKAKLSIYPSIDVPTHTYGHEICVMTERMRLWTQAAEMSVLCMVAGRTLRDRVSLVGHPGGACRRVDAPPQREGAS